MRRLQQLTTILLDASKPAHSLRPEVIEMTKILADASTLTHSPQLDIATGETRTANGLAIGPAMAARCADDFVRTVQFIRGAHAAIVDVREQFPDRPARLLYVGTGPYATLAVPLMTLFSSSEATFTLLDIHPASVRSTRSVIRSLGLSDSVVKFETADAGDYCICPSQIPDIILIELMQVCLEAEPQVAVARHLLPQAPNAIMIPETVCIEVKLVDPSKEFAANSLGQDQAPTQRDRLSLGAAFVLNRASVNSWKQIADGQLPGLSVRLPRPLSSQYQLMLCMTIGVYQEHELKEYDSGLTCPRNLVTDGAAQAGDTIQFHYALGAHPQLRATALSSAAVQK